MTMNEVTQYKWIEIIDYGVSKSGKTKIFRVMTKDGTPLGEIKWNCGWRKYWFLPLTDTGYEEDCLIDIADFLKGLKVRR